MRKTLLAGAISLASVSPFAAFADIHDARSLARGGTGLTTGGFSQALYNPALINHRPDDKGRFSLSLSGGAFASDKDKLIDAVDDFQDLLDKLEDATIVDPNDPRIEETKDALANLSDKLVQVNVGGSALIAIPNDTLSAAFVAKGKASIGLEFLLESSDISGGATTHGVIGDIALGTADGDDLNSRAHASILWVQEYGLMLGKDFEVSGINLDAGATLKLQTVELISYSAGINDDIDVEDMVDSNNLSSHTNFNIDLGTVYRFGDEEQFALAGTIENLIPKTFSGPGVHNYKMAPVITAGAGYNTRLFKAEANLDLTQRNGYDLLEDTQFASVGVEFSAGRWAHLRAGYRTDLKSNVSDLLTAGIGIGNFLDISGGVGEGNTYAAAIRFAVTF